MAKRRKFSFGINGFPRVTLRTPGGLKTPAARKVVAELLRGVRKGFKLGSGRMPKITGIRRG